MALAGAIRICVSGEVYAEYEEVIGRPRFGLDDAVIRGALQAIREKAFWVKPSNRVIVSTDADDDIFLECAEEAQAAYLVTGNLRHFPPSWKNTAVITPRRMLDILETGPQSKHD